MNHLIQIGTLVLCHVFSGEKPKDVNVDSQIPEITRIYGTVTKIEQTSELVEQSDNLKDPVLRVQVPQLVVVGIKPAGTYLIKAEACRVVKDATQADLKASKEPLSDPSIEVVEPGKNDRPMDSLLDRMGKKSPPEKEEEPLK